SAALHLRERLRAPRGGEPRPHGVGRVRGHHPIPRVGHKLAPVMESMLVAGVDFGTQSVRVSIVDSAAGVVGHGVSEYPVVHHPKDPDFATQSHESHMNALCEAMRLALESAGADGMRLRAMALDTTGSTVIPVGEGLAPLDDYYLWCDHRAKEEAARITEVAHDAHL